MFGAPAPILCIDFLELLLPFILDTSDPTLLFVREHYVKALYEHHHWLHTKYQPNLKDFLLFLSFSNFAVRFFIKNACTDNNWTLSVCLRGMVVLSVSLNYL